MALPVVPRAENNRHLGKFAKGENMNIYDNFAASMSDETNLPVETAQTIVQWLSNEGVLDVAVLKETYPTEAANDA